MLPDGGGIFRVTRIPTTRPVQQTIRIAEQSASGAGTPTIQPLFSAPVWFTPVQVPPAKPPEPPEPPQQRTDRLVTQLATLEDDYQQMRDGNRNMPGAGPYPQYVITETWTQIVEVRGELRDSLTDQIRESVQKADPGTKGDPYQPIVDELLERELPASVRPSYEAAVEGARQDAMAAAPANRSEARAQRQAAIERLETISETKDHLIIQYVNADEADRPAIMDRLVDLSLLEQAQLDQVKTAFDAEYAFIDEMSRQAGFNLRPYEQKDFETLPVSPSVRQEVLAAAGVDDELGDLLFTDDGSDVEGRSMLADPAIRDALQSGDPERLAAAVSAFRSTGNPSTTTPDAQRDATFETIKRLTPLGRDLAARIDRATESGADKATVARLQLQFLAVRDQLDAAYEQQSKSYKDPQDLATFDDMIDFLSWQRDQLAINLANARAGGDASAIADAQDAWIKADAALQDTQAARTVLEKKIAFDLAQDRAAADAATQVAPTEKIFVGPGPWPNADVVDAMPLSADPEHEYTYVVDGEQTSWWDAYGGSSGEWSGIEITEDISGGMDRRFVDLFATNRAGIHEPGDLYNPLAGITSDPSRTQIEQVEQGDDPKWTVEIDSSPSVTYRGQTIPFENLTVWRDGDEYKFSYELAGEKFKGEFNDADARAWEAGLEYRKALEDRAGLQLQIQPLDRDQLHADAALYDENVCDLNYGVSSPAHHLLDAEKTLIDDPTNAEARQEMYAAAQAVRVARSGVANDAKVSEVAAEQPELDELERTIDILPAGPVRDAMANELATRRDTLSTELHETALDESIQRDRLLRILTPPDQSDGSEYEMFQKNALELARPVLENFYVQQPDAAVPTKVGSRDEARRYVMRAFGVETTDFDSLPEDDREFFGKIADQIAKTAGDDGHVVTLPVIYHSDDEGIKMQLVFGVETAGGSRFLVDLDGSRFDSESDYRHHNRTMQAKGDVMSVMPADGWPVYDSQGHVQLSVGDARIESGWETFKRVTHVDLVVAVVATGAAIVIAVGSGGLGAPVSAGLLATSWGVVIASSAYGAYNAIDGLADAHAHGRSLNPADGEARANWLSLGASLLPMPAVLRSSRAMLAAGRAAAPAAAEAAAASSAADAAGTSIAGATVRTTAGSGAATRIVHGAERIGSWAGKVGSVEEAYQLVDDWSQMTTGQREEALMMTAIDASSGFLTSRAHDWSASRYAPVSEAPPDAAPTSDVDLPADVTTDVTTDLTTATTDVTTDLAAVDVAGTEPTDVIAARLRASGFEIVGDTGRPSPDSIDSADAADPAAPGTVPDVWTTAPVDDSPDTVVSRLQSKGLWIAGVGGLVLPLPSDIHAHLGNDCAGQYDRLWLDNPENLKVLAWLTSQSLNDPSKGPKIVFQVVPQAVPHGESYYLARNKANQPYQVPVVYHFKEGILEVKGLVDPETGKVIVEPSFDRRPDLRDRMLTEVQNRRMQRGDSSDVVYSQMPDSYPTVAYVAPGFPLTYEGMVSDLQAMRNLRAVHREDSRAASRFYLGLTAPDPGTPMSAAQLREMLWVANQIDPNGDWLQIFGLGETTLAKEGVTHQLVVPPDLSNPESIHALLDQTDEIGAAVVIHSDSGQALLHAASGDAKRTGQQPGTNPTLILDATSDYTNIDPLFAIFKQHPDTPIVWAHAGGLGRTVRPGPVHLDVLRKVIDDDDLSHVRIDLSWDVVNRYLADTKLRDGLADLVNQHPGRFIYGSDSISPRDPGVYYASLDTLRDTGFLARLTPDAAEKFLRGNFDELVEKSAADIKAWRLAKREELEAEFGRNHSPAVQDAMVWIHDGFDDPGAGALPPPAPDGDGSPTSDSSTPVRDASPPDATDGDVETAEGEPPSPGRRGLLTWKTTATAALGTGVGYATNPKSDLNLPVESAQAPEITHGIAWTIRGGTAVLATAFPNTRAGAWAAKWRNHVNAGTYAANFAYHFVGAGENAIAVAQGDHSRALPLAINVFFGAADAALGLKSAWDIRNAKAVAQGEPGADTRSTRNAGITNVLGLASISGGAGALGVSRAIESPDSLLGSVIMGADVVGAGAIAVAAGYKAHEGWRALRANKTPDAQTATDADAAEAAPDADPAGAAEVTAPAGSARWYRDEKTGEILWSTKIVPTFGLGVPLAYYGLRTAGPVLVAGVANAIENEETEVGFETRATTVESPGSATTGEPAPLPSTGSPTLEPGTEPDFPPPTTSDSGETPPTGTDDDTGSPPTPETPARPIEVIVEPGDSLWRIAARHVDQVLSTDERAAIGAPGSDLETWTAMIRLIEINPQRNYDESLLDGVVTADQRDPDLLLPGSRVRVTAEG